jgi:hypothetical protein
MSDSAGTLVCMRKAISYCARRVATSGSSTQSGWLLLIARAASMTSRCCSAVTPGGRLRYRTASPAERNCTP